MSISKTKNAAKAALVTAALTVAAGSVQAETPYVFTAIDTAGHGVDIVNGQYDKANARIRKDGKADLDFSENTSLCIAYTYSRDVANAKESCDRAVEIARIENGMPRFPSGWQAPSRIRAKDMDLVIALSNRSVVHATNGEFALAFDDLHEADALRPHLRAVSKNLAVLKEVTASKDVTDSPLVTPRVGPELSPLRGGSHSFATPAERHQAAKTKYYEDLNQRRVDALTEADGESEHASDER